MIRKASGNSEMKDFKYKNLCQGTYCWALNRRSNIIIVSKIFACVMRPAASSLTAKSVQIWYMSSYGIGKIHKIGFNCWGILQMPERKPWSILNFQRTLRGFSVVYLEPCQTYKMKVFAKIRNGWKLLLWECFLLSSWSATDATFNTSYWLTFYWYLGV